MSHSYVFVLENTIDSGISSDSNCDNSQDALKGNSYMYR